MGTLACVSTSQPENVCKKYVTVGALHQCSSVQIGKAVYPSKIYRHFPEKEPGMKSGWDFFFFLHNVFFQILFVRGKRDKYSLWQTKINGWVQKCREQAVEEDVGSTGHRRTACMCQWKYTLTWTENSCDTFTVIISWNVVAESSYTNFLNTDGLYLLWAVLTMMVMEKVNRVYEE